MAGSDGLVDLDFLNVHPLYQSDWEYRHPEDSSDVSSEEDEDDSNDENNWRNDYPDSDHRFVELISVHILRSIDCGMTDHFKVNVLSCPIMFVKIKSRLMFTSLSTVKLLLIRMNMEYD